MSPLLIEVDLLTCVSCHSLCIICTQPPPYQKQIDEHLQKWSPPKSGPILVFPVGQNMSPRNWCNGHDLFWRLSFGGKNHCFVASRQFTSITSLSNDEYYKFWAIITSSWPQVWVAKENIFTILQNLHFVSRFLFWQKKWFDSINPNLKGWNIIQNIFNFKF